MSPQANDACPACGAADLTPFYRADQIPTQSCRLSRNPASAAAWPRADLELALCSACGFITNRLFDAAQVAYDAAYEDQQCYSATFDDFARGLAQRLMDRHDLRGRSILDIGCGKGDFLRLLCELGDNTGIGIDPAVIPQRQQGAVAGRITWLRDTYGPQHADLDFDWVCCRHTLEHIHPVRTFLATLRAAIGERDVGVFFEVPDAGRVLAQASFEDIYYEHCSYFTAGALARLFRRCGFRIQHLYRGFGDQYLMVEARPVEDQERDSIANEEESPAQCREAVAAFRSDVVDKLERRREQVRAFSRSPFAIWGSGSKCVSFLCAFDWEGAPTVVDINPHRHGLYLPGSAIRIEPPDVLREKPPSWVLAMNSQYREEIEAHLQAMGLTDMPVDAL